MAVATGIGALRLTSYRPEGLGLGLSLLVVACFVDWFRRGERASLVAGCLVGVALANVHGIALLGGCGDAGRGRRGHHASSGMRRHLLRVLGSGLALLASVAWRGWCWAGVGANQVGNFANQQRAGRPDMGLHPRDQGQLPVLPPSNRVSVDGALTHSLHGAGPG